MPTIGQKLETTRVARGLSIEDVAHETRIHPNMILSIEEDDFSRFPSVAYAKSFIRKYAAHLELDLSEAMDALNSGVTRFGDNEFMGEMKKTIKKDRRFRLERFWRGPRLRPGKTRGAPLFLNFILAALMGAIGIFWFLGYNAPTPEKAREGIARGLGLPLPVPAPDVATETAEIESNPLNPIPPPPTGSDAPAIAPPPATITSAGQPAGPGTPPVYPVLKPAVDLEFDDTLDRPAPAIPSPPVAATAVPASPELRPRETPRLDLGNDTLAPPPLADVPAVPKERPEPQAVLRPEGTDPAATTKREPEPGRTSAPPPAPRAEGREETTPAPAIPAAPQSPLRAVPVAASE